MHSAVVQFEILGVDPQVLQGFYGAAFGWQMRPLPGGDDYVRVETGAGTGIDGEIGVADSGTAHLTVYVTVDDVDATVDRVQALGGRCVTAPADIPGGPRFARIADPEGNVVGLVQRRSAT